MMTMPVPPQRPADEPHILLPGKRVTIQPDIKAAPRAPRRLRIVWIVLTVLYVFLVFGAKITPVVAFLAWSIPAAPLAIFSKYRPFPQRLWLKIPMIAAWVFLLLICAVLIISINQNAMAQTWRDQIVLPPLVGAVAVVGGALFPLVTCVFALRAKKKPLKPRHG